jgi:hypothetical protein
MYNTEGYHVIIFLEPSLSETETTEVTDPAKPPRPKTAKEAQEQWREILKSFYPDILTRPYCVPHVYFNRVPYEVKGK